MPKSFVWYSFGPVVLASVTCQNIYIKSYCGFLQN